MTTAGLVVERQGARRTASAVIVLQLFALTIMLFPSDTVIKPIGANGYVASLVALTAFGLWVVAIILGFHDPRRYRSPIRVGVSLLWLASLVSYMVMNGQDRSVAEVLSADRWLIQLAAVTGVIFVAAEFLGSLDDVKRVLRALVTGGAACGAIAALQYWFRLDLSSYLRSLPGFSLNADAATITTRASLARVAGAAIHPIELGVVAGMLLPLALYLALYDRERSPLRRWVPTLGIFVAIPVSVSRSGVIAVVDRKRVLPGDAPTDPACRGLALRASRPGHGLHGGARHHRYAHVVLCGRDKRSLRLDPRRRSLARRGARQPRTTLGTRWRHVLRTKCSRDLGQSVLQDGDRARARRTRCRDPLLRHAGHHRSRRTPSLERP